MPGKPRSRRGRKAPPAPPTNLVLTAESEALNIVCADGEDDSVPTYSMVAYTGGMMRPAYWAAPVVVNIAGATLRRSPLPNFHNHVSDRVVGHAEKVSTEGGRITLEGKLSGANEWVDEIIASSKRGFPWQASIGGRVQKIRYVAEGESAQVNGKTFKGPLYVAEQMDIGEVSFVPAGADNKTSARIAASEGDPMDPQFVKWLEAKGFDAENLNDQTRQYLEAQYERENAGGDPEPVGDTGKKAVQAADGGAAPNDDQAAVQRRRDLYAAEEERCNAIRKVCANQPELCAKAIKEGWTPDKAELESIRAGEGVADGVPGGFAIHSGNPAGRQNVVQAAACMTLGMNPDEMLKAQQFDAATIDAADKLNITGVNQLVAMAAQAVGVRLPNPHAFKDLDNLRAAAGSHDISNLLGNVINKSVIRQWDAQPQEWRQITGRATRTDFKTGTVMVLGADGVLQEVKQNGEVKQLSIEESAQSYACTQYAANILVTERDWRNDDLQALTGIPRMFARAANQALRLAIYAKFVDNGSAFFKSANGNTATEALAHSAIVTLEKQMMEIVAKDGTPGGLMPDRILVPPALNAVANEIYKSDKLVATGVTSTSKRDPSTNIYQGKLLPVVSDLVGAAGATAGVTGATDTNWWMLANPAQSYVVEVGFVGGRDRPVVRRKDPGINYLALGWQAVLEAGCGNADPAAGIKSTGGG